MGREIGEHVTADWDGGFVEGTIEDIDYDVATVRDTGTDQLYKIPLSRLKKIG